ncbi:MAG: DMT family transporter [Candidatus Nanopelagicaceae bacterium]|nr:DMT family transporter [Candidatus Nanopelagicaceae bacterium]
MNGVRAITPLIFVLLWSTGFIGAKYILPYAEPFVFLTIRYLFATLILVVLAKIMKESLKISKAAIKQSMIVAVFLHVIYIGGVFYAVSIDISAGITAVIVSLQPILVSLLAIPLLGERLSYRQVFGLALGFIGVLFLLSPKLFEGDLSMGFSTLGIICCVLALLGTTAGYLLQKKGGADIPFLAGTAVQFATSTIIFAIAAVIFEPLTVDITLEFVLALTWIVVALSIGSIFLLYYLLRRDSASSVSSLYYLVPPLTALQAYYFFDERIKGIGLIGMVLAALGTLIVTRNSKVAAH